MAKTTDTPTTTKSSVSSKKDDNPTTQQHDNTITSEHNHAGHSHNQAPRHPEIGENKEISITIAWEKVDQAYQSILKKYQPHVKTDGFRKGHAPLKIVEQMVGPERLYQETAEKVLPEAYVEAVKKAGAKPISDPEIHPTSMELGKDWTFHAHIAEKPEVKLGKYVDVAKKAAKQFDEEQKKVKKQTPNKAAQKPESALEQSGSPDSARAARADESDVNTVSDSSKDEKLNAILAAVRESVKPVIPELLVKQEAQHQLDQLGQQMKMYNIELSSYLKSMGKTEQDIQAEYVGRALASWQLEVILDAIATEQKLEVVEQEIEDIVTKNYPKPEEITSTQKAQLHAMQRKQKVFEYLLQLK